MTTANKLKQIEQALHISPGTITSNLRESFVEQLREGVHIDCQSLCDLAGIKYQAQTAKEATASRVDVAQVAIGKAALQRVERAVKSWRASA